ncbi:DUF1203 domain-containing protein [Sphingomonas panacisoli]|uniref:DUF1203 domain-containing protein n=1 Tax=Sphingomonas panacisoli TaxID=1813879 RepID=A0A5B8LK26_9SPHN|nr:DUF1203 domain-containing protein [Sphingomonas panacisoli]QDZ08356.1 DUF1203 domain-containing protein [Sphingomonas panacisoli]
MAYMIRGLDPASFEHLFGLSDAALAEHNAVRRRADTKPGFPCRVTLEDAEPGEDLILLNHQHLPVDSPYRGSYAIYVREGATEAAEYRDAVPLQLARRLLALRAFDDEGMLLKADVIDGSELDAVIEPWLADPAVAYLHAYNAKPGCFAARIDRG